MRTSVALIFAALSLSPLYAEAACRDGAVVSCTLAGCASAHRECVYPGWGPCECDEPPPPPPPPCVPRAEICENLIDEDCDGHDDVCLDMAVWDGGAAAVSQGAATLEWGTRIVYGGHSSATTFEPPNPPDWSAVAYVVFDEPYSFFCGAGYAYSCSENDPPPDVQQRYANLNSVLAAIKSAHPGVRTWVNLSVPEILWWNAGYLINPSNADVISLDYYGHRRESWCAYAGCNWRYSIHWQQGFQLYSTLGFLEFVRGHLMPGQQMGLVPPGFTGQAYEAYNLTMPWRDEGTSSNPCPHTYVLDDPLGDYITVDQDLVCTMQLHLDYALAHSEVVIFAPWPWPIYGPFNGLSACPNTVSFLRSWRDSHL